MTFRDQWAADLAAGLHRDWTELTDLVPATAVRQEDFWPVVGDVFAALHCWAPAEVEWIFIGQDPYPGPHAIGLAFALLDECQPAQPTLGKIVAWLQSADRFSSQRAVLNAGDGPVNEVRYFNAWALQNHVLLLNAALIHSSTGSTYKQWRPFVARAVCLVRHANPSARVVTFGWRARQVLSEAQRELGQDKFPEERIVCAPHPMARPNARKTWQDFMSRECGL